MTYGVYRFRDDLDDPFSGTMDTESRLYLNDDTSLDASGSLAESTDHDIDSFVATDDEYTANGDNSYEPSQVTTSSDSEFSTMATVRVSPGG